MLQPIPITLDGGDLATVNTPLLFIALPAGSEFPATLSKLDSALGGSIKAALDTRDFRGARDEVLYFTGTATGARRIALVGGGTGPLTTGAVRRAAAIAARNGQKMGTGTVAFAAPGMLAEHVEVAVQGLSLGAWRYLETKSLPPENERKASLDSASIVGVDGNDANKRALDAGLAIAAGQWLARTLGMMPGNLCTPDFLADTARELAKRYNMQYTMLDRAGLERERMGSFLSVAQGTPQEPRLVAMEYSGGKPGEAPVVLVGKGLCFDTGGISIKPAPSMEWMKFDMCGAAGVIGAMEALGRMKLPINVVGIFGATTNMPSGTAVKPGDVVQASSGKFIEIINTDAEGRLVLADLLVYARRFKPAAVLDAATLTGACVIALGHTATGVCGTDQKVIDEVLVAGDKSGERAWQLPLWDDYRELIKSDVADIKNSGGRPAGTITAAYFLKEFADEYPWAHLDIAGTAYSESDLGFVPKGPTGVPVGTFVEFLRARAAQ